jgi:excisionase family DNA binding protein
MPKRVFDSEPLLTPAEVSRIFRVDPKTVTRWARTGRISSVKTLGGHRRYPQSEIMQVLADGTNLRVDDESGADAAKSAD